MNILIDIGNTRLKWGIDREASITAQTALIHGQNDWQESLFSLWQGLEVPEKLAISSVANPEVLSAVIALAKQLWPQIQIMIPKSQAVGFGVKNSYQHPEKLGIDRWLCLVAAHHYYRQAAWIVDCGTAITVDFIDANGIHAGGLIAPGLTLMKKSLLKNTAALNFSHQSYKLGLANLTEAAIFSGTLFAVTGLIEQALKMQPTSAVLLLTGGDAALVSCYLQRPAIIEPDLVLKGLALFSHS